MRFTYTNSYLRKVQAGFQNNSSKRSCSFAAAKKEAMVNQQKLIQDAGRALDAACTIKGMKNMLSQHGFGSHHLKEGISILNRVKDLQQQLQAAEAQLKPLTRTLRESCIAMNIFYEKHQELSSSSFGDTENLPSAMAPEKGQPHSLPVWLTRMNRFYKYFTTDEAVRHGITIYEIEQVRDLLISINRLERLKQHTESQRQQAIHLKDTAMKELQAWLNALESAAKNAFADKPEQLKALGFAMKAQ